MKTVAVFRSRWNIPSPLQKINFARLISVGISPVGCFFFITAAAGSVGRSVRRSLYVVFRKSSARRRWRCAELVRPRMSSRPRGGPLSNPVQLFPPPGPGVVKLYPLVYGGAPVSAAPRAGSTHSPPATSHPLPSCPPSGSPYLRVVETLSDSRDPTLHPLSPGNVSPVGRCETLLTALSLEEKLVKCPIKWPPVWFIEIRRIVLITELLHFFFF